MAHALTPRATSGSAHPHSTSLHFRHLDPRQQRLLEERRREHDEQNRAVIRTGLISLAGFFVVAGLTVFLLVRNFQQKEAERQAVLAAHASLRAELLAPDALRPQSAAALLRRIDETKTVWQVGPDADAIAQQGKLAREVLEVARVRDALAGEVAALQREVAAGSHPIDGWRRLGERVAAVQARLVKGDGDLQAQVGALVERVDAGWFDALVADAGTNGRDPRAALRSLTAAVDLGTARRDAAERDRAAQHRWKERLRGLAPAFDAAAQAVYTPTAIGAVPWSDLQPPEAAWVASRTENLTRRVDRDGLRLACTRTERPQSGVVVLRHDSWHGCALSFDVRLEAGSAVLFGRSREQIDERNGGGLVVTTATGRSDEVTLPAGQDVHVEMVVVGDRMAADVAVYPPRHVERRIGNDDRRGTFAALVHPGAELTVRNLRIRRLD